MRVCGYLESLSEKHALHVAKGHSYRQPDPPQKAVEEYKRAFALDQVTSMESLLTAADTALMIEDHQFARDLCAYCRRVEHTSTADAIERTLEYLDPQSAI